MYNEEQVVPCVWDEGPWSMLVEAYASAQGALERLDDRMRTSPYRRPWAIRTALIERQALAWADGFDLPEDALHVDRRGRVQTTDYDLTHWKAAIGVPITLKEMVDDPSALLGWLGYDGVAQSPARNAGIRDSWEMTTAVTAWARACSGSPPCPPLLGAARMAALWRLHAPLGRGDMVASLLIGDRWSAGRFAGSRGGLVALGLRLAGSPWKTASGPVGDRIWLEAIVAGARAHLEIENRLRLFTGRARAVIERRQRIGRLKELLLLALERPTITSALVAERFGLTSAGAIKLLRTAHDEGLLLETTGQASYRCYAIPISESKQVAANARSASDGLFEPDFWGEA